MTDARGYTIQNTVDSFGRITSVRQPDMSETRFEYDASGHLQKSIDAAGIVTLYTYNPSGQLVEKKEALSQTEERTHSYISDIYGNILSETDGRGNTKISHYDAFDRLIEQTSPEGKKVSMSYDANGNQTTLSRVLDDGTTITTNFTYTLLDKVATVITPIDSTHARTTTYTYDGDDRLTMTQVGSGISIQRFEYNAFGEITKTQNGLTNPYVSLTTYDANGNKQTETLTGVTYTYTYDGFDRIQKITNPQGTERRFLYDANGNTIDESWYSATGMILGQTKNEYDTQNHITKTQVLLGTGGFATTEYGYDSRGNRTKMIDALGYITTYGYDTLGRQTRTTLPNGAQKTLVYDKNDNILSETELIVGKDFVTNHTYDRDNRRLSTTTPDNQTTTFAYNTLDQQTKVTSAKNRETNRTYDYEGRLLTESVGGKTTRYEYDLL
jgi:YD repeat-containing protein